MSKRSRCGGARKARGLEVDERVARMALASVIEPGDPGVAGLLGLHSAEEVWEMLLGGPADSAWSRRARETSPEHLVEATERCGARFVIPSDSEWPAAGVPDLAFAEPVQDIGGVPLGLWVSGPGDLARWSANSVAIVGSRAATAYGESVAIDLAAGLAELGVTVLSGGAYGIDAAAHRGAMAVEAGSTVAVVACGVDTDYPPGHRALFERMRREHLLVSELAPGQHPTRRRFLVRNRLIAALTQATVIVEAGLRSGASNTANWASAIGRPLLAVPGSVNSAMSQTPHRLIREQRAILATNCAEVVEVLTPFRPPHEVDRATGISGRSTR